MQKCWTWPLGSDRAAALSPTTMFHATCYSKSIFFSYKVVITQYSKCRDVQSSLAYFLTLLPSISAFFK